MMLLEAILTVGWEDDPADKFSATRLHAEAEQSTAGYRQALTARLSHAQPPVTILGLDQLFRRSRDNFKPLKYFVSNLSEVSCASNELSFLGCRIDVFAYAYLKGAINFDLLLPESATGSPFREVLNDWSQTLWAFEDFECQGQAIAPERGITAKEYLALRRLIARPSAQEERRTLATLLISGPSTGEELADELDLNYSLERSAVSELVDIGVVELRANELYALARTTLPLVVFCLRETMGIDLLVTYLPKRR